MKGLYPPFGDPRSLPRRILVIAPHPDDEVFGCGGMLAWHGELGAEVRILVLTDGGAGDPEARTDEIRATRREESLAAGRALGDFEYRFLGFPDGALGTEDRLAERLREEIADFDPALVYAPSPLELHPDHRAASAASLAALRSLAAELGGERRALLYGVNAQVPAGVLFDTTPVAAKKRAAIACFESQLAYQDLAAKCDACDRARTVNVEDPKVETIEGFVDLPWDALGPLERSAASLLTLVQGAERSTAAARGLPETTAVISTWNKADVLRENLDSLRAQTLPFARIVVVDNASKDDTARIVADEYPEVSLIVMPHSAYGACETFNIGFASARTPLVAILDDDITLPPDWLERTTARLLAEPETTAVISTEIIEPGMPESYIQRSREAGRRYMSTFRGCGSLARREALAEAGYYDERLFIYGNERDLTCRLLNLGYRVLQDPEIVTYHKTPFGIQMGKRSLFYHARNAWLSMLKYAPLSDLLRMPFLVVSKVLLRGGKKEAAGEVTDATGTIGIGRAVRETPGAVWILFKASCSILYNLPYCLRHRAPVRAKDFELPLG
ncbi:MAG TPA: glycosyltransferase [Planctomycetes bacterium]|nr:glycosyltransferase [Planctomycetota bacterium]